jgi:hypothetical protein
MLSPNATVCSSCGLRLAALRTEADKAKAGCGCISLVLFGGFVFFGLIVHMVEKLHPSCVSDFMKCADNEDIVKNHRSKDGADISIECEWQAKNIARFGEPVATFNTFYKGRSYLESGVALLIDKDAKFKNGFGVTHNVRATCLYDLKLDVATVSIDER